MFRYGVIATFILFAVAGRPAAGDEQRPRWLGGAVKAEEYESFQPPGGKFTIDVPKREWQTVPGAGAVIVVFSQAKSEASVALEHTTLKQALAPDDITQLFVDIEVQNIKERDTEAAGFRTALRTDTAGNRVIAIDFTRQGLRGPERVRQFSLPSGTNLFRLICSASPTLFDRYAPVFEHMAETFKSGAGAAAPGQ